MPSGPDFMLIVKSIAMLDSAIDGGRKWYGRGLYSEVEKLLCIHEENGNSEQMEKHMWSCIQTRHISDTVLVVVIF